MMPHHSPSLFEALPGLPGNARSRVIGTAAASGEVLADDGLIRFFQLRRLLPATSSVIFEKAYAVSFVEGTDTYRNA
jgi:hypothetical protein